MPRDGSRKIDRDTAAFIVLVKITESAAEIQAREEAEMERNTLLEEDFKASAQKIDHKVTKKSPDKNICMVLIYTDKPAKVIEDNGITLMRVEVRNDRNRYYSDVVTYSFQAPWTFMRMTASLSGGREKGLTFTLLGRIAM